MAEDAQQQSFVCQEHGGEVGSVIVCDSCGCVMCDHCAVGHRCILDGIGTDDPAVRHGAMAAGPAVDEATRTHDAQGWPKHSRPANLDARLGDMPTISQDRLRQVTLRSGRVVNEHGPDETLPEFADVVGVAAEDIAEGAGGGCCLHSSRCQAGG